MNLKSIFMHEHEFIYFLVGTWLNIAVYAYNKRFQPSEMHNLVKMYKV